MAKIKSYRSKHVRTRKRHQVPVMLPPSKSIWLKPEDVDSINQVVQSLHAHQSRNRPAK